jgi:hypothetical protein
MCRDDCERKPASPREPHESNRTRPRPVPVAAGHLPLFLRAYVKPLNIGSNLLAVKWAPFSSLHTPVYHDARAAFLAGERRRRGGNQAYRATMRTPSAADFLDRQPLVDIPTRNIPLHYGTTFVFRSPSEGYRGATRVSCSRAPHAGALARSKSKLHKWRLTTTSHQRAKR